MKNIRKISTYPKTLDKLPFFSNSRKVAAYARVSTSSEEQLNSIEAQKDYYKKTIERKSEWEFCGLYADEGMSGISHKNRVGFNKMIDDALSGKFNLIITKSISRFARNTVDTLACIRKLKEHGVEVYFEKEDLWTFDSKGEFMLTLLSSMAQEESRSISENVTWGQRKSFADGKYHVPFKQFLGYDKGPDGEFVVNEIQAITIRLIFKLFLEGHTPVSVFRFFMGLK